MRDREVLELAARYGFSLARRSSHLVFRHPDGMQVVTSASCTDWRRLKNAERDFKRALQQGPSKQRKRP